MQKVSNKWSQVRILEKKASIYLNSGESELAFLLGNYFNNIDDPNFIKPTPYNLCKQNFYKAKYWLEKAVQAKNPDAMMVLGNAYLSGLSCVKKNTTLGNKLIKKAKSIYKSSPSFAYMAKRMLGDLQVYSR